MSRVNFGEYLNRRRVLIIVCVVIVAIVALRFYHMSVTGFMIPDEGYYYETIVLGHKMIEGREVFSGIFALFFGAANSVSSLALIGAIYASVWGLGSTFLTYKMTQMLGMPDEQASLLLVSLLFFPVFLIMLPMLVTETMALFFALVGIVLALRFHQHGRWIDALLSSLAFVAAYKVREPYLLFGLANFLGVFLSGKRSARSVLAYLVPLALVFPIRVEVSPPFAEPLYASLLSLLFGSGSSSPSPLSPSVTLPPPDPSSFLYAFGIGLFFGYNPIFTVIAFVSVFLSIAAAWRKRNAAIVFPPWNALAGLGAYAAVLFAIPYSASGLVPAWTSTAVRASHASLPTLFTFDHSYRKVRAKNVAAMLLILLVVGSSQLPLVTEAVESNLTRTGVVVDRFNLGYRAPYYRLYELAKDSGRTIVFALNLRGARTYLSMLPNAQIRPVPANESQFRSFLAAGWDTIYLYDSWYTVADPSSLAWYPHYYADILVSHSYQGYAVQVLWVDAESYAFRMSPVAPAKP